jgi:two-component system chemotaxis response regulator CheY
MRFLVVDDSTTMRRIIMNAMKTIGFDDLVEAADGNQGLQRCDETINLVITDWNMPVMSGLEFVRQLRAQPKTARTPVLMVTTRSAAEDILQAKEAGVTSYILKPFTPQVLKAKIDEVRAAPAQ